MVTMTLKQNQRCSFQIEHNGIRYRLGVMIPGDAKKKVHQFVRKYLLCEWQRIETTAVILADGKRYDSVWGIHQNRDIRIIHQT